jgi:hypothetical protein
MENLDKFNKTAQNYSKKKKLNVSEKEIPREFLDGIEKEGVTLEKLEELGQPVFFYKTQITIHGKFPELKDKRVLGYKSIIRNKNQSIGVKYSAIDAGKIRKISNFIHYAGFRSTSFSYNCKTFANIGKNIKTREDYLSELERAKAIYEKIDNSLFYGEKECYISSGFMGSHIIVSVTINAIYEKNVEKLIESFGVNYHEKLNQMLVERKKRMEQDKKDEEEMQKRIEERRKNKERLRPIFMQYVSGLKPSNISNGTFLFWSERIGPCVIKLEKSSRQKMYRFYTKQVDWQRVTTETELLQQIAEAKEYVSSAYTNRKLRDFDFVLYKV